jgi:hypothetical protein
MGGSLTTLRGGREALELANMDSELETEKRALVITTLNCIMGSIGPY